MTPRTRARTRRAAAGLMALAAVGAFTLSGCDPRALAYFLSNGPEIAAPGPSLKGKRVVFVTAAVPAAQAGYQAIDRELNREVIKILREKAKKVEIVDPEKVGAWVEAHPTWTDQGELARAFEADMVVFFEVQGFSIEDNRSPGLLEGNAEVSIRVTELAHPKNTKGKVNSSAPKEATEIYNQDWKTTFPKTAPLSVDSGVSRSVFKSKFLRLVASELSWQFVGHDHGDDIQDTRSFGR